MTMPAPVLAVVELLAAELACVALVAFFPDFGGNGTNVRDVPSRNSTSSFPYISHHVQFRPSSQLCNAFESMGPNDARSRNSEFSRIADGVTDDFT